MECTNFWVFCRQLQTMRAFFICLLIFYHCILFGQNDTTSSEITLLDSSKIETNKLVTLLKTDKYTIFTTYPVLIQDFENWLASNPKISIDNLLFEAIRKDTIGNNSIPADRIASRNNAIERLNFRIGELLNSGNCFVVDVIKKSLAHNVTILKYSYVGVTGTKYFIGEDQILDLIETVF